MFKGKLIYYSLSASFIIFALSFAYYLLVVTPNKQKAEREFETNKINVELQHKSQQEQLKQQNLENCLAQAHESYINSWNANCPNGTPGCNLSNNVSSVLDQDYKDDQELCIKKYK
jgi:CMP-N-acetylneuraminic acid synthetase